MPQPPLRAATGKLEAEFAPAYLAWQQQPSPETTTALLTAVQPVLNTALRTYGGDSPATRGAAKRLAIPALKSYRPEAGSLRTHLLSNLRGLQRYSAQTAQLIHVPEQMALDQRWVRDAGAQLADELGREPSLGELADKTGLSIKRLSRLQQYRPPTIEGGLHGPLDGEDVAAEPAVSIPGQDLGHDAWLDFVYQDLPPIDQVIFDHSLGRHGLPQLSTQEIARKLRLTPSAVSQRAAKIQQQLDERERLGLV